MHRLSVLGPPQITGPEAKAAEQLLRQPKRLALLVYLILSRPHGPQLRERLFPLLWPEADSTRARSSLRQAVRSLRGSLGSEIIVGHGSVAVEVNEELLCCDARAFDLLLDQGNVEAALALYRGDLLDGFYAPGVAPEYEHWLDRERARLKRRALDAIEALVRKSEAEGEWSAAVHWSRRGADIEPSDEVALRRLVRLLHKVGDLRGAEEEYERFAWYLETTYQSALSSETQELVRGFRRASHPARAEQLSEENPLVLEPKQESLPATDPLSSAAPADPEVMAGNEGESTSFSVVGVALRPRTRRSLAFILLSILLLGVVSLVRPGSSAAPVPGEMLAVLPFRTGGADPALAYLSEGMVDLIAMHLGSNSGPGAIDPQTILQAWRRATAEGAESLSRAETLRLAEQLGASEAMIGEVVGAPDRILINATLLSVNSGQVIARATAQGVTDSLAVLVDRLASRILMVRSGMAASKLQQQVPLTAVRAHLDAEAHYRRGDFQLAARAYRQALEIDSTFAPAALGALSALRWAGDNVGMHEVAAYALRFRDRLAPPERALLDAHLSAHTPTPQPQARQIAAWEEAVRAQPTNVEAWYYWGDMYYHWGPALGLPNARAQARLAFERAVALDPEAQAPISHLAELLAVQGEVAGARRVYAALPQDAGSEHQKLMDWLFYSLENQDRTTGVRVEDFDPVNLTRLIGYGQLLGVALGDVNEAVRVLHRRAVAPAEMRMVLVHLYHAALNRGRLDEVRRVVDWVKTWAPEQPSHLEMPVMAALYSDGDSVYGASAARTLSAAEERILAASRRPSPDEYDVLCTVEQWKIRHGNTTTAEQAIAVLRLPATDAEDLRVVDKRQGCATFLMALLNIERGRLSAALPLLEQLSWELKAGVYGWWEPPHLPNLVLAEVYESIGRPAEALAVLRRRPFHSHHGMQYLSSFLTREARLATTVGDTAGARRAYQHYLALREKPHRSLEAEADEVRRRIRDLTPPGAASGAGSNERQAGR